MSCFIYLRPSYVPLLLLQEVRITSLQVSHMLKNNSFSLTQQKHYSWMYLDITAVSGLQSFPPLATRLQGIRQIVLRPKSKKKIISLIASLSFAWIVSNKFHQGTINDCKFMSVDASQFCLCRNPTNCLLSMNKSAHRCIFCNETVKHDKSVGLTHSRVKTDIELLISLVFSAWEHIKSVAENMWIGQKNSAKLRRRFL